jgi:hypothetical protein
LKYLIYLIIVASKYILFFSRIILFEILFRQHDIETQYYALALINIIMSKGDQTLRLVKFIF